MPVNSRYLGNTYSSSSSLYKKAQAAQKKVQSLEDTEMKYLWDTNQIDNNAYFDYASTRFNEVTDQIDKQTWDRTIRSVNKEIVSDYKNAAFYEISKTPGNTS
ncbi:MAG: hypothetical protein M0R80_31385, partial [Proteobacteria bacterium]|nr:hypothetical protein [Pseudomonadota bacterium]